MIERGPIEYHTIRPLATTGQVFGTITPIGPGNLMGVEPEIEFRPTDSLTKVKQGGFYGSP